jgi:hypothetical protein
MQTLPSVYSTVGDAKGVFVECMLAFTGAVPLSTVAMPDDNALLSNQVLLVLPVDGQGCDFSKSCFARKFPALGSYESRGTPRPARRRPTLRCSIANRAQGSFYSTYCTAFAAPPGGVVWLHILSF